MPSSVSPGRILPVSEHFKKRESDVIWRVSFRGQWLYVYLLIEFQSTVDRFMALRLMVYVGLLYQRVIDAMVTWAWQPEHRLSVKRLERWARALLWQSRLPEEPEPDWDDIEECGAMLKERVKQWEKELIEKGIAEGMERGIQQGIEQGMEKGIEQGIEQGIQQGIERGVERGEAEVLVRQLETKFGLIPDEFRKRIDEADSQQLLIWAERILTAGRLEDVFDG